MAALSTLGYTIASIIISGHWLLRLRHGIDNFPDLCGAYGVTLKGLAVGLFLPIVIIFGPIYVIFHVIILRKKYVLSLKEVKILDPIRPEMGKNMKLVDEEIGTSL